MTEMTALELIKLELKDARITFEDTVRDVSIEMLGKDPGGMALPLEAAIAHLILFEDLLIQKFLAGKAPLYESSYLEKTGLSSLMPNLDENWSKNHLDWAKSLKMDLSSFNSYKQAVYEATDSYINSLKEEDMEKEIDMGAFGKHKVAPLLFNFIIAHTLSLTGEISAAKGVQGQKGYAF